MQFGPPLDKRKMLPLVEGTEWHQMIELNRMAFSDALPRNSESRALGVAMRLLREHAPQVKWVLTFADGTQCGDGTIYWAAGFLLTAIKPNDQLWVAPGEADARFSRVSLTDNRSKNEQAKARALCHRDPVTKGAHITHSISAPRGYGVGGGLNLVGAIHSASLRPGIGAIGTAARTGGGSSMRAYIEAGFRPLPGFQLRYVRFLDPSWRDRLTVPVLPYSAIAEAGASMYRGERAAEPTSVGTGDQPGQGGATPTRPLHDPGGEAQ